MDSEYYSIDGLPIPDDTVEGPSRYNFLTPSCSSPLIRANSRCPTMHLPLTAAPNLSSNWASSRTLYSKPRTFWSIGIQPRVRGSECTPLTTSTRATHVPVGEDQSQHLEFSRECVTNFNHTYGPHLVAPKTILCKSTSLLLRMLSLISIKHPQNGSCHYWTLS